MGVWSAIAAAKRGASVCLADQFTPAHEHGSSHGDGRIYRLAYTEDLYVDMMEQSLPQWHELQRFAGTPLLAETGGINLAPIDGGRLTALGELYARRGIAHEWLSAGAVSERFPQFGLDPTQHGLYQPQFGVLFASKCIHAAWEYARHLGVHTVSDFRAAELHTDDHGATLVGTDGNTLRGTRAVLAPGPWLSTLASSWLGLDIPTLVSAETVCYYAPTSDAVDHSYTSMPVFIPEVGNGLGPFGYYGLPMIDVPGIKCSAHYCGPNVHPDHRPSAAGGSARNRWPRAEGDDDAVEGDVGEAAARARVDAVVASTSRYIAQTFPHVEHTPFATQSCLYTTTPDHDYIISRAPAHPSIVLAGGGSGHAFKMGPAIGEAAASLALGEAPPFALERFAAERLIGLSGAELDHEARAPRR